MTKICVVNANIYFIYLIFVLLNFLEGEGLYVKTLLEKFQDGLMVLKYYDTNVFLNGFMWNKLSTVLIKAELHSKQDNKIDKTNFCTLAKGSVQYLNNVLLLLLCVWVPLI